MYLSYVANLLALGLGLAAACHAAKAALPLPPSGRIAFGIAATPFVAGSLVLALILIAPGLPAPMIAAAPVLTGLLLLAVFRKHLRPMAAVCMPQSRDAIFWAELAATAAVLIVVIPRMAFYAGQPNGNSDALQYLAEARHLLSHRSFFEMAGIWGLPDGTLRGDAHGALWVSYLAGALAWTSAGAAALGDEAAPRLAFQFTLFCYAAAGLALASAVPQRGLKVLVFCTIMAVPQLPGASIGGDRDAFRLAGLLLLSAFLLGHAQARLRQFGFSTLLLGAVLGCWAVQGHGLAIVIVPLVVAPWALVSLPLRLPIWRTLLVVCAISAGFTAGAWHVVTAYRATGSLSGNNVDAASVVRDTVYAQGVERRDAARIGEGNNLSSRLRITVERDQGWPSLLTFGVLVSMLVAGFARVKRAGLGSLGDDESRAGVVLSAWFVSQSLLLFGVFDIGTYKLSEWTVLNSRYAMQWYLYAGLFAAWGVACLPQLLAGMLTFRRPQLTGLVSCAVLLATAAASVSALSTRWLYYPTTAYRTFAAKLNAAAQQLPSGCKILSEDTGVTFVSERPVLQLYSVQLRDLLTETEPAALLRKLDDRRICAVVLYTGLYVDTAGPETPLSRILAGPAFRLTDADPWRIYVRDASGSRQPG
ncbi:hypothetical protein [Bosea beijingensis]